MDRATWQERAERELGRPMERLDFKPAPGIRVPTLCTTAPKSSRGELAESSWSVSATHAGNPESIATQVAASLEGGVEVIRLDVRLTRGARDLGAAVTRIVDTHRIELVHSSIGEAGALVGLADGMRKDRAGLQFDFGLDPIGRLARDGFLQGPAPAHMHAGAELAQWCAKEAPACTVFTSDGSIWHDAGADEPWAMAMTVATAVQYLRAMDDLDVPLDDAFSRIRLVQSIPGRFFVGAAKLRATRRMVARIAELCGGRGTWLQTALPAWRERSQRDVEVNVLRSTASTFGAIIGGADRIDVPSHTPGHDAQRLARNTQLILRDESHLGVVADPAGGSYALETLTDQLASRAWALFQQLEAEGGMLAALESGFVQTQLAACRERADLQVRTRKHPILGVTRFADLDGAAPIRPMEDEPPTAVPGSLAPCESFEALLPHALHAHASELSFARVGAGFTRATPVSRQRLAEPFEQLRDRADRTPRSVYIATLGPLREHTARTAFGRAFLAAGGLRSHVTEGVETPAQALRAMHAVKCRAVLLSMADARFATDGLEAAKLFTEAGSTVWCLGKPGDQEEALRAAGVQGFLFAGTDLYHSHQDLWKHA